MSMRRPHARSKGATVPIACSDFGWEITAIATLRHTTLPWFEGMAASVSVEAVPLSDCASKGTRDRLSILGQYAAHVSFLKFAGLPEESFRPEEWSVVFQRGRDCRLLRLRCSAATNADEDAELSLLQAAASLLGAPPLPVLKQSWGKAEHVYHEVDRLLRNESRADISWFRRAATGTILAPSSSAFRALLSGTSVRTEDASALQAVEAWSLLAGTKRHVMLGGGDSTPLVRYSAVRELLSWAGESSVAAPASVAERVLAAGGNNHPILVLQQLSSFDRASRELLGMLLNEPGSLTWLIFASSAEEESIAHRLEALDAGGARTFLLSPRAGYLPDVAARICAVPESERNQWLDRFVQSEAFSRFIDTGAIAAPGSVEMIRGIPEPRRSYLAAIALIGKEVDRSVAEKLLAELGSNLPLEQVVAEPMATLTLDRIVFADESAREALLQIISADTRRSLSRLGSTLLESKSDNLAAARLAFCADDAEHTRTLLESVPWWPDEWQQTISRLDAFPEAIVRGSDVLCDVYARAAIRAGRYRRARSYAELLPVPRRDYLCALAERRLGNYAVALDLLRQNAADVFEPLLLEGELLRLTGENELAALRFERCAELADSRERKVELGFHRALLSFDRGEAPDDSWIILTNVPDRYLVERCLAYRHLAQREYAEASERALLALECALDVPQKIDAALDLMEASFLAGNWEQARHRARQALSLVEETEGDRAAGGILFLLAYLCADEGQWEQAARKIERLRAFYGSARDPVRLREIDLLEAQLALGRGELLVARRKASLLAEGESSSEVREAAALIIDEVAWTLQEGGALASTGESACIELNERHLLQRSRRLRHSKVTLRSVFSRALLAWECGGSEAPPLEQARTGAETLQLLRAMVAAQRRGASGLEGAIAQTRTDLGLPTGAFTAPEAPSADARELGFLQQATLAEYPYPALPLGDLHWRFATRNRLGTWNESGSLPAGSRADLDSVARDGAADWLKIDDHALLYAEGLDQWTAASRRTAGELFRMRAENFNLKRLVAQEEETVRENPEVLASGVIGQSAAIRELMALASRVARRDVPICILGESGTGKELVARAIHSESLRRSGAFTAVNCAALPEHLVESELFGHVRGAFTGADRDRPGLIEASDRGTLFLDEIGELPLAAQAKLLRFLQEGEFRRVGETVTRHADVRIVAATNRKLEQFVDDGKFREDLYYRVRVIELKVPPLRERGSDIIVLARHFLFVERDKHGSGPDRFSAEVEHVLASYTWPGNVRELQNTVRAAHAIAAGSREIELDHLPERLRGIPLVNASSGTYFEELVRFRKSLVERSLQQVNGNQSQAAKILGMSRQALAYQIRELGILIGKER